MIFVCSNFFSIWNSCLTVEQFLECGKVPWLCKSSLNVKNSLNVEKFIECGKFPSMWKSSLSLENFHDCGKASWMWKSSPKCGKVSWMWKSSLIVKTYFFDYTKIIDLKILEANANVKTIKTYILNLGQKLSSLTVFVVDKINIMLIKRLQHKYGVFNLQQQQKRFIHT